jgi:hypothetical protein
MEASTQKTHTDSFSPAYRTLLPLFPQMDSTGRAVNMDSSAGFSEASVSSRGSTSRRRKHPQVRLQSYIPETSFASRAVGTLRCDGRRRDVGGPVLHRVRRVRPAVVGELEHATAHSAVFEAHSDVVATLTSYSGVTRTLAGFFTAVWTQGVGATMNQTLLDTMAKEEIARLPAIVSVQGRPNSTTRYIYPPGTAPIGQNVSVSRLAEEVAISIRVFELRRHRHWTWEPRARQPRQ